MSFPATRSSCTYAIARSARSRRPPPSAYRSSSRRGAFRVTRGTATFWSRPTDTGHMLECALCANCGARLWHQRRGAVDTISVKGGSLDETVDLRRAVHIWTSRILPGITVPEGAAQFPGEPE